MSLLQVRHRDGTIETLNIVEPLKLREGKTMWRLVCADGAEHFFNMDDGTYDGWGRCVADKTEAEVGRIIKDTAQHRYFPAKTGETK